MSGRRRTWWLLPCSTDKLMCWVRKATYTRRCIGQTIHTTDGVNESMFSQPFSIPVTTSTAAIPATTAISSTASAASVPAAVTMSTTSAPPTPSAPTTITIPTSPVPVVPAFGRASRPKDLLLRRQRPALPARHRARARALEPANPRDHILARVHRARLPERREPTGAPATAGRRRLWHTAVPSVFLLAAPPAAAASCAARRPKTETGDHRLLVLVLAGRVGDLGRLLAAATEDGRGVSGALAAPEARGVVVGRADEDVPQRVVGKRPNVRVVCLRERCARPGLVRCGLCDGRFGGRGEVPVHDRALGAAGDKERVEGVPGHGWVGMSIKCGTRGEDVGYSQHTSFLWPLRRRSSFIARMSKTRTVWSRDALATRLPFGDHARAWTVFLW